MPADGQATPNSARPTRRGGRKNRLPRGAVVWGRDAFCDGDGVRPWLVLDDGTHPFHGEEYLCVPLTRTERDVAVRITYDDWVRGGSPVTSFANPWSPTTRKPTALSERQGVVRTAPVDRITAELARYAGMPTRN